jgi:hypothetical protein
MRCGLLPTAVTSSGLNATSAQTLTAAIDRIAEELSQAAPPVEGGERRPCSRSARRRHAIRRATVIDGPFIEAKELLGG